MTTPCYCWVCRERHLPWELTAEQLLDVIENKTDDVHAVSRVHCYIEVAFRIGKFYPDYPYVLWAELCPGLRPPAPDANRRNGGIWYRNLPPRAVRPM
jgi:hypothetical protein